jgi:hypothetical protein
MVERGLARAGQLAGSGSCRRLVQFAIEQGPHEHAVISKNTTALISNTICLDKLLVYAKVASIGFVVRQAWKAKKRQCAIARPF